jgi:hypothetical protein
MLYSVPLRCDLLDIISSAGLVRQKKAEEDATFYWIKDGTFFPLFCLTNPAQVEKSYTDAE